MEKKIHYAEVFRTITLIRGKCTISETATFLCGARNGEGSTVIHEVTCPKCWKTKGRRNVRNDR